MDDFADEMYEQFDALCSTLGDSIIHNRSLGAELDEYMYKLGLLARLIRVAKLLTHCWLSVAFDLTVHTSATPLRRTLRTG